MKWNWGTGLFIFFTLFVATLVFVLVQSRKVENSLVYDQYYEEDLHYQEMYDKKTNTARLEQKVAMTLEAEKKQLALQFPMEGGQAVKGEVLLYNPVSKKSDVSFDIKTDTAGFFHIPLKDIANGRWKVKIDWQRGTIPFYQEEELIY